MTVWLLMIFFAPNTSGVANYYVHPYTSAEVCLEKKEEARQAAEFPIVTSECLKRQIRSN